MKKTLIIILILCAGCAQPVQKPRELTVERMRLGLSILYSPNIPYEIYSQLPHRKKEMAEYKAEILRMLAELKDQNNRNCPLHQ